MIYLYVIIGMCSSFLLSVALLLFYLRYKKNILQQQFHMQESELANQKRLTQVIITSQEQERKRIGKELHDDVGNALASLRLYLDKHLDTTHLTQAAIKDEYNKRITAIYNKLRTISHQLSVSEIELFGLREALFMLSEQIEQSGNFTIKIDESKCRIPEHFDYATAVIIYRVFQELLTNTIKHAAANEVQIRFDEDSTLNTLLIAYKDNGKGMITPTRSPGLGFKNIESRLQAINGRYEIEENKNDGFGIHIFIPRNQPLTA